MIATKIHLVDLSPDQVAKSEKERPTSCTGCGACCAVLTDVYVDEDECYVPVDLYDQNEAGEFVMNQRDDGSCVALNLETRECDIYGDRPRVCRAFPVGCGKCLAAREELGVADE